MNVGHKNSGVATLGHAGARALATRLVAVPHRCSDDSSVVDRESGANSRIASARKTGTLIAMTYPRGTIWSGKCGSGSAVLGKAGVGNVRRIPD